MPSAGPARRVKAEMVPRWLGCSGRVGLSVETMGSLFLTGSHLVTCSWEEHFRVWVMDSMLKSDLPSFASYFGSRRLCWGPEGKPNLLDLDLRADTPGICFLDRFEACQIIRSEETPHLKTNKIKFRVKENINVILHYLLNILFWLVNSLKWRRTKESLDESERGE